MNKRINEQLAIIIEILVAIERKLPDKKTEMKTKDLVEALNYLQSKSTIYYHDKHQRYA